MFSTPSLGGRHGPRSRRLLRSGRYHDFLAQYHSGARNAGDATLVTVTQENGTAGIDFVLSRGGIISGSGRDSGGSPVENALIHNLGPGESQPGNGQTRFPVQGTKRQ